jgi:hypothetical protein
MSISRVCVCVLAIASTCSWVSPGVRAAQHAGHTATLPSDFLEVVRRSTERFLDVRDVPAEYGPVLGCVTGPEEGAMGVHFVNGALLSDAALDPEQPEALIYETKNGATRLVGVEFIVFAELWHKTHAPSDPPVLEGQLLHFVDAPNRFGLPAHYELHVWAWRDNPRGLFVDWNPRVSCDGV